MKDSHWHAVSCLLAAVGTLVACKTPQTFEEAIRVACEYPEQPEVRARIMSMPPSERAPTLAKELKPRIQNPQAIRLFEQIAPDVAVRDAEIAAAVKRAGLTRCWMTDPPPASSGASGASGDR